MHELHRLRRAGGGVLRMVSELIPIDRPGAPPISVDEDVCLVFADVEDYSDFVATAGDTAAIALLGTLDDLVDDALAGREGVAVIKRLGDGLMIVAREPDDALKIAVELTDGFDAASQDLDQPLRLRTGVHRGTCRRHGDDYFGYHVNLAARVTATAHGGQTLATANALAGVDLDDAQLAARSEGQFRPKGANGKVAVFSVWQAHRPDEAGLRTDALREWLRPDVRQARRELTGRHKP